MGTADLEQSTGLSKKDLVDVLNILIGERKVQLYNYADERGVVYRLEDPELSAKCGETVFCNTY